MTIFTCLLFEGIGIDFTYETNFVYAAAFEIKGNTNVTECHFNKFTYFGCFSGCNHKIFGFLLLQNQIHGFHVVFRMSPVAL